jgi:alpha-1,6-mannosyltransferase
MPNFKQIGLVFAYIISFVCLHFFVKQADFVPLLLAYSAMFAVYIVWLKKPPKLIWWLVALLVTRFVSFFALPSLSDDFYRFLWDGMLTVNGGNPFLNFPVDEVLEGMHPSASEWLAQMNSANYYSVYPVFSQWIFAAMYSISDGHELGAVNVFRCIVLLAEIGVCWFLLLKKSGDNQLKKYVPLLLLNPLYLVETYGNIHFEGLVVMMLVLAVVCYQRHQKIVAVLLTTAAFLTKLIPLIILPVLLKKLNWKERIGMGILGLAFTLILCYYFVAPLWLSNQLESMRLYFQVFEFNAGLYFLIRWIGFKLVGYNIIAWIGAITPWIIGGIALYLQWAKKWNNNAVSKSMYYSVLIYYGLSSIVHPWYAIYAILPGLMIHSSLVVVWSYAVIFSYVFYAVGDSFWYYCLVFIEYVLLLLTAYFFDKKKYFFKAETQNTN